MDANHSGVEGLGAKDAMASPKIRYRGSVGGSSGNVGVAMVDAEDRKEGRD
jgi:hypothetical protein